MQPYHSVAEYNEVNQELQKKDWVLKDIGVTGAEFGLAVVA